MIRFVKVVKRKTVWIPLVIGLCVIIFFLYRQQQGTSVEFSSTVVERIDLVQSVEETGTVKSQTDLAYGWEISGRVSEIIKDVGSDVVKGDIIAVLENAQETSRLREAQSLLASAQAQLNLRLVGPSDAQIATSLATIASAEAALTQAKVRQSSTAISGANGITSAEKALEQAIATVENTLASDQQDIDEAYEDAVETAKSALTTGLDVLVAVADLQSTYEELAEGIPYGAAVVASKQEVAVLLLGIETSGKRKAEYLLGYHGGARGTIEALSLTSDQATIDAALRELELALIALRDLSNDALNALTRASNVSTADRTRLDTARTNINSAVSSIVSAKQVIAAEVLQKTTNFTINDLAQQVAVQNLAHARSDAAQADASAAADVVAAEASLAQAQASHQELIADPRSVDVASLRADVSRQAATVAIAQEELQKTQLIALADGVVSRLDVAVGETVTANQEVFGLVSPDLTVEVDISETDIAKVAILDPVEVTLDAFGDDRIFMGSVAEVEPAETEISGVIYYKTTVRLDLDENNTEGVRPGMTANVRVVSETKPDVIVIPRRAVLRNGHMYVRVLTSERGDYEERVVTTGLQGDDGLIEIISGLQEGEEVITFIKESE